MFNLFSASAQIGVEDKRNAYNNRRFYARTARLCENSVLIQLAQIPNALRLTYERRLDYRFVVGANASLRFLGEEAGTVKSEVFGKFFVNKGRLKVCMCMQIWALLPFGTIHLITK